ncbi:MAG: fibronectin type III domain-containing protein, partial [Deltaproteobacteria bacterium]|nr:fibronectin type III domain-containing protein [Deltaproteobacteria bacterium]
MLIIQQKSFFGGVSVNFVRNLLYTSCVLFFVKLNRPVKEIFNCILVVTIFGAFFLVPGLSFATSVTIGWDPNTEAGIAGYRIYYGEASGDYWFQQDVGNKTGHAVNDLEEGKTYYFAVTAYN